MPETKMTYKGPTKLELLVLITKYNLAYPTDKIKPQITATVNDRESNMVNEIIAKEATHRAQYPYNSFQRQALKLQPLLEKVTRLTNFESYNNLDWMELLIAVNDMLKLVRSQMQEADKIRSELMKKDLDRRLSEHAAEKLRRAKDEQSKFERRKDEKKTTEKAKQTAVEQAKANTPPKEHRPNKLQKKPNPLIYPTEANRTKEQKIETPDKMSISSTSPKALNVLNAESVPEAPVGTTPPLPPRCPHPMMDTMRTDLEACGPMKPEEVQELKGHQTSVHLPEPIPPPPLPPRKESPSRDDAKPATPPIRPVLLTRTRSKDEPKKKVSFDGTELDSPKDEDTVMTGMDMGPAIPGAWRDEFIKVLSIDPPQETLPKEKAPKRKKGREPEHHQAKMDKAHYDALRVTSEINKFSWPGEAGK
ncbi:hypothetical protein BKA64DRAFT_769728 [Cadophora sp. MPI-SDFR-AT-0126]|nr:hypothetical protein BKA64DRAFT_769728 [Leotiomycetes sp. MPI-SDFR-AT-0126]